MHLRLSCGNLDKNYLSPQMKFCSLAKLTLLSSSLKEALLRVADNSQLSPDSY